MTRSTMSPLHRSQGNAHSWRFDTSRERFNGGHYGHGPILPMEDERPRFTLRALFRRHPSKGHYQ